MLRVRWVTMPSAFSRTGSPGPARGSALVKVAGTSLCVTLSPNS